MAVRGRLCARLQKVVTMKVVKAPGSKLATVMIQVSAILALATVVALSVNQLRPSGIPLVADWSPEVRLTLDSGESIAIPLEEAEMLFFAQAGLFLDARSAEQFAEGHIEGALNLPWDEFDQRLPEVLAGVSLDTPLITYCDGEGCALSKELALALSTRGYTHVRVLVNGWTLWQEKRLPVERNESAMTSGARDLAGQLLMPPRHPKP